MGRDFSKRSAEPELMDAEGLDYDVFRDCLADLAKVNRLTLAHRPTLRFIDDLWRSGQMNLGRPIAIVDIGSGYGDLLSAITRWASRRGAQVRLTGIDLNPWSARAAAEAWRGSGEPQWVTGDIFDHRQDCDLVVTSLVPHHLSDIQIPSLLNWMEEAAGLGWFINDLHRHPVAFHGFRALATAMRWHPFVRHDGPVSIARAFTAADWRGYLEAARIAPGSVEVSHRFPFRLCVSRFGPRT